MTNGTPSPDRDLIRSAFEQLMQQFRKQTDSVLAWTKYYLSIQAALATALAFLIKLGPSEGYLVNVGSVFIPFLGVVTTICLTNIILREQMWEGRFMKQIIDLPLMPKTFLQDWVPEVIDPKTHGYIGKMFCWPRTALVTGWIGWGLLPIIRDWL